MSSKPIYTEYYIIISTLVNLLYLFDNVISLGLFYHTTRGGIMVADKIKALREQNGFTQSDLAKKLGITRSSVNAWEMGISVPSTQYVVELANIFKVSTDFLLGVKSTATVNVEGLSEKDVQLVNAVIAHLREKESAINHQ